MAGLSALACNNYKSHKKPNKVGTTPQYFYRFPSPQHMTSGFLLVTRDDRMLDCDVYKQRLCCRSKIVF